METIWHLEKIQTSIQSCKPNNISKEHFIKVCRELNLYCGMNILNLMDTKELATMRFPAR